VARKSRGLRAAASKKKTTGVISKGCEGFAQIKEKKGDAIGKEFNQDFILSSERGEKRKACHPLRGNTKIRQFPPKRKKDPCGSYVRGKWSRKKASCSGKENNVLPPEIKGGVAAST